MACSSGCPTPGAHLTFGECLRSKNLQVEGVEAHRYNTAQRRAIDDYVDARREGMQPASVFPKDVARARAITKATGIPYQA